MLWLLWVIIGISVLAILFAAYTSAKILKQPEGTDKMKEISKAVHEGAMAFLHKEYRTLAIFMVVVTAVLYYLGYTGKLATGKEMAVAFVVGGFFSALAGNIGMRIATKSNARTAFAAKKSLNDGLKIAFSSGAVMGLTVVGLGLLGVTVLYLIFKDPNIIFGFGFGASSIALFARVGGGIYTKAADVGADIVGKVEAGIPEDDPRNPATIADNVGDNVGDVAGMGADLFESYVDSIIAAMVIGAVAFAGLKGVVLPLALAALGIIASITGTFFVRAKGKNPGRAMDKGVWAASIIMVALSYFLIMFILNDIGIFYATISGLIAGIVIGLATEYYTSSDRKPTKSIAEAARTGAATDVIQGLSVGMISTVIPVLAVSIAIWVSFKFGGLYGIAISAVGMLSTLGITLATDCYGPVADNAAGIAEMSKMGGVIRKRCEGLDSVGNTTAAIGKGFAIGSAALTALALFVSYTEIVSQLTGTKVILDIISPNVTIGLFIGAMLPFLFSALAMRAVGTAAGHVVDEVRRQFKQIKGIMEGKAKPDYARCVTIVTGGALKQMVFPTLLAIVTPIIVGLWSLEALGGLLVGTIVTGFLLAIFMANAGGAFDNAKKYIEGGKFGGKGSDAHKAAVVGDTVGDPLKDTSGPSLNILIKLMSIVAIIFVPLFL